LYEKVYHLEEKTGSKYNFFKRVRGITTRQKVLRFGTWDKLLDID